MALGNKASPHAIAEKIKRLNAKELALLSKLLVDDHMADKLIPAFEAEIYERDFKVKQNLTVMVTEKEADTGKTVDSEETILCTQQISLRYQVV